MSASLFAYAAGGITDGGGGVLIAMQLTPRRCSKDLDTLATCDGCQFAKSLFAGFGLISLFEITSKRKVLFVMRFCNSD